MKLGEPSRYPKPARQHGCPPGQGTMLPAHGGQIGQPPHVPTEDGRAYVRENVIWLGQHAVAIRLGISERTIARHYRAEIDEATDDAIKQVGSSLFEKALAGDGASQRFFLITRGRGAWSPKVTHHHSAPDGGPIRRIDLTEFLEGKTEQELLELERTLELLAAAGALDFAGGDTGGAAPDEGEAAGT